MISTAPHVYPEGCYFNTLDDIKGKKVTIMGLGLNGGGEASVRFFLKYGAIVTVTDMKTAEQLAPTLASISMDKDLDKTNLTYVLGRHRIEDFANADCVIKNPGVKYEGNQYLEAAKNIETDISIFLHFTKAPIIAVTGSKGKSSTVSAIDFGLRQSGYSSFLGGNITVSPLTFLEQTNGLTPVVLELSSWQLRDLRGRKALKPKIAIITKIVPDHQNWYGEMDAYVNDKKLIYADMDKDDCLIVDADSDGYESEATIPEHGIKCWGDLFASEAKATIFRYSRNYLMPQYFGIYQARDKDMNIEGFERLPEKYMSRYAVNHGLKEEQIMGKLLVPGEHMKTNVLNAALALRLMGVSPEQAISVLGTWKGINHRLELFLEWHTQPGKLVKDEIRTVRFYNDSAATVPEAAAAASQAFDKRIVLICGGTDKDLDFTPLAKTLSGANFTEYKPREIFLLAGSGTDKLKVLLDQKHVKYQGPFESLNTMLNAFKTSLSSTYADQIYGIPNPNDPLVVVFSPGATSFGMFTNEFDRGDKFKAAVKEIFV